MIYLQPKTYKTWSIGAGASEPKLRIPGFGVQGFGVDAKLEIPQPQNPKVQQTTMPFELPEPTFAQGPCKSGNMVANQNRKKIGYGRLSESLHWFLFGFTTCIMRVL